MARITTFILICAAVLILDESVEGKHRIQTPKAAEFSTSLGALMVRKASSVSILPVAASSLSSPKSNFVYKVNLAWDYDPDLLPSVSTFTLYIGRSSGVYDYCTNSVGTNLSYAFSRTNSDEEGMARHFFVVTAKDQDGTESTPSNEAHFPAFPPDHFQLSWVEHWDSVGIFSSVDLAIPKEQWNLFAYVEGANSFSTNMQPTEQCRFFILNKPDVLTIRVFNPNP